MEESQTFYTPYGVVTAHQCGAILIDEEHCLTPDRARVEWAYSILTADGRMISDRIGLYRHEAFDQAWAEKLAFGTTPEGKARAKAAVDRARKEILEGLLER